MIYTVTIFLSIGLYLCNPMGCFSKELQNKLIEPSFIVSGSEQVDFSRSNVGAIEFDESTKSLIIFQREHNGIVQFNINSNTTRLLKPPFLTSEVSEITSVPEGFLVYSKLDLVIRCYTEDWQLTKKIQTRSSGVRDLYPGPLGDQFILCGRIPDVKNRRYILSELLTVSRNDVESVPLLESEYPVITNTYSFSYLPQENKVYGVDIISDKIISNDSFTSFALNNPFSYTFEELVPDITDFDRDALLDRINSHNSERVTELIALGKERFVLVTILRESNFSYVYYVTPSKTEELFTIPHYVRFATSIDEGKSVMLVAFSDEEEFGEMIVYEQELELD